MKFLKTKKSVILVGIFIFIGFTLWFVYKYSQEKRQVDISSRQAQELQKQIQDLPQKEQENLIVATTSITALKTYYNEEFGFEFQHPENWSFEINSFHSPFSKFNLQGNSSGTNYNPFYPDFLINIVTPDFVERQFLDLKNIAIAINVGGVTGFKYEYKEGEIPHITIILPFGQYKIILGFGSNKEYGDIFNQILTTFKVLNK